MIKLRKFLYPKLLFILFICFSGLMTACAPELQSAVDAVVTAQAKAVTTEVASSKLIDSAIETINKGLKADANAMATRTAVVAERSSALATLDAVSTAIISAESTRNALIQGARATATAVAVAPASDPVKTPTPPEVTDQVKLQEDRLKDLEARLRARGLLPAELSLFDSITNFPVNYIGQLEQDGNGNVHRIQPTTVDLDGNPTFVEAVLIPVTERKFVTVTPPTPTFTPTPTTILDLDIFCPPGTPSPNDPPCVAGPRGPIGFPGPVGIPGRFVPNGPLGPAVPASAGSLIAPSGLAGPSGPATTGRVAAASPRSVFSQAAFAQLVQETDENQMMLGALIVNNTVQQNIEPGIYGVIGNFKTNQVFLLDENLNRVEMEPIPLGLSNLKTVPSGAAPQVMSGSMAILSISSSALMSDGSVVPTCGWETNGCLCCYLDSRSYHIDSLLTWGQCP